MTNDSNSDQDRDEAQQRLDQLNDALLEAYAAGFAKGAEFVEAEPDFDTDVETLKQKEPVRESHYFYWDGRPSRIELWLREQVDDPEPELVTDGGTDVEATEDYRKCPEPDCGIEMPGQTEIVSHLKWDHNRSEAEAEAMLDVQ